jgi:hypothetical protein
MQLYSPIAAEEAVRFYTISPFKGEIGAFDPSVPQKLEFFCTVLAATFQEVFLYCRKL